MQPIDVAPLTDRFNLMSFTDELIDDLKKLRKNEISVHEAHARANLAKQILKAVHYTIVAQQFMIEQAKGSVEMPVKIGRKKKA